MPGELGFFIQFNTPCPSRCKTFPSPDLVTAGAGSLLRITEFQDPRSSCPPVPHNLNLSLEHGKDLPKVTQSVRYITQDRKRSGLCFGHPRLSFTQLRLPLTKEGVREGTSVPELRLLSLQERPRKAASEPLLYSPPGLPGRGRWSLTLMPPLPPPQREDAGFPEGSGVRLQERQWPAITLSPGSGENLC